MKARQRWLRLGQQLRLCTGLVRAWPMLATMEAQSGLGQGSVRLRLGCRQGQGCAGQRHWWLSRAGRELWQWQ